MELMNNPDQPVISITLPEEEFAELIKKAIKNNKIEINHIVQEQQKQWLTVAEAAEYISASRSSINLYMSNYRFQFKDKPQLKYTKIGAHVRINVKWLDELAMAGIV